MDFLVELDFAAAAVPPDARVRLLAAEREVAFDLRRNGVIQRMWRVTGHPRTVSVWRADDEDDLARHLDRLPLRAYLTVRTTALGTHYLEEE